MTQISAEGFILTTRPIEKQNQSFVEAWLVTKNGPVKVVSAAQQGVFFIQQAHHDKATQLLNQHGLVYEYKALALKNFEQMPVAALYFPRNKTLFSAKTLLQQQGVECLESDIRYCDRYLMERFIYGSATFIGQQKKQATHVIGIEIIHAQAKPSSFVPTFNVLSIDIECSEQGELFSIGLASNTHQSVLMIGEPQGHAHEWIKWITDEKTLLQEFIRQIALLDPDILIGWNVVNFDFQLIIKRAALHKVKLNLGRENTQLIWRDARGEKDKGYVSMPGRMVIDGIDALKNASYQFASFSLENVAQSLLGKGKKSDDVDNRLAQIEHDFNFNKVKLAEYNLQDCQLVLGIFEHTQVLDFLILRSQLTGLELDRMGGSVAAFINLYLPKLHRAGYVSPNRPEDGGLASPGGYVMNSKPGLYKNILVLDFKSLYPSIIRTFKIDPLGLVEGLLKPDEAIQGYRGAMFSREQHFLPEIITSLWKQRDQAKKAKDGPRSQAIKILMNSFYGVLGSGGCPFYDTRLASSITMRGHDIMLTTAKWIEQAGYQVIYGDTDSTFVWLEDELGAPEAIKVGQELAKEVNQKWHNQIAQEHQLSCHLEIEFETHFSQFLMPTIRGSELGSKKRYAGLKTTQSGQQLVFKGLETVRSDWTELAKMFQQKLYSMVFAGQNVQSYLQQIIEQTRAGALDDLLVYRKRLRRPLDQYVKNVPPHVKAARHGDKQNAALGKPLQYQNKAWVAYVITLNGPESLQYQTSQIDYDHYVNKQIKPIAEGILPFIGLNFEQVTSQQMGLF